MASRYFINGGVNSNYNDTSNWSASSGGSGGSSVPTSADDVFLDANSPNCTVNVSSAAKTIDATGYTGTLAVNDVLAVSGSITLGAGMTLNGSNRLDIKATGTITSNGVSWGMSQLRFDTSGTVTLADDMPVSASTFTFDSGLGATINGNRILVSSTTADLTSGTGTTAVHLVGTSTVAASTCFHPITINTSGTVTFSPGTVNIRANLTYVAGTVVTTGTTLRNSGTNATWDTDGVVWNNVEMDAATFTLSSDLTLAGTLTLASNAGTTINGSTIYAGGSVSLPWTISAGTTTIVMNGTGTLTVTTGTLNNDLEINTSGTITVASLRRTAGVLTYTTGTLAGVLAVTSSGGGGGGAWAYA